MKTMCPPSYYHNGLVATHALGCMMNNVASLENPTGGVLENIINKSLDSACNYTES